MKQEGSSNPIVSIIIATYNRADLLPETLDSIIDQSYKNWECIIVDDGSNDNTEKVVRKYIVKDARIRFFPRPKEYKKGPGGAFNYGFDISEGEFIQWFGSDDLMHAEMLSEKVKIFIENPNVQSVYSQMYFFEQRNNISGQTKYKKPYKNFYENAITWNIPMWSLNFMFRNNFLKNINIRFDESLKRLLDYDFHSRLFIKYPHDVYMLDKPLCYVRRNNKDSITTKFLQDNRAKDLEKSEYIVANKIIRLLVKENKFTKDLEKYFYREHKRRISNLIRVSDYEFIESFKELIEYYLRQNKKHFKLVRFRLGFSLIKKIPIRNLFLIYKLPKPIHFIYLNLKRI